LLSHRLNEPDIYSPGYSLERSESAIKIRNYLRKTSNSPGHSKPADGEEAVEDEQENSGQDTGTGACM
jgi:hypothetical protein